MIDDMNKSFTDWKTKAESGYYDIDGIGANEGALAVSEDMYKTKNTLPPVSETPSYTTPLTTKQALHDVGIGSINGADGKPDIAKTIGKAVSEGMKDNQIIEHKTYSMFGGV